MYHCFGCTFTLALQLLVLPCLVQKIYNKKIFKKLPHTGNACARCWSSEQSIPPICIACILALCAIQYNISLLVSQCSSLIQASALCITVSLSSSHSTHSRAARKRKWDLEVHDCFKLPSFNVLVSLLWLHCSMVIMSWWLFNCTCEYCRS